MPASDKNWYSLKKLHLVFAFSSAALFLSTLWMMKADHDDEWRGYQTTFDQIEAAQIQATQNSITTDSYNEQLKTLQDNLKTAQTTLNENASQTKPLEDQIAKLTHQFDLAKREDKNRKAFWTKSKADYDLAIRDGFTGEKLASRLHAVEKELAKVNAAVVQLEKKNKELNTAKAKLAKITKERDLAKINTETLQADIKRLQASKLKLAPENWFSSFKRNFMEWPIIDGFNSHHKIEQIWCPELKVRMGMTMSARFDRCITCHQGMDKTVASGQPTFPHGDVGTNNVKDWVAQNKFPHPFATHPRTDLFLTSTSPHPMQVFGCTACHDGQGSGTDFSNASHTPNNPFENEEWAHEHGYKSNHFWELPMQPKRFAESTCLKCHHTVTELAQNPKFGPTAPKLNRGFELIKKYGCFGCHEINGFEGSKQIGPDLRLEPNSMAEAARIEADPSLVAGQMRKVGPSLRYLSQKVTSAFAETWTKEPKAFRPSTKMPQFFDLTNQGDAHAKNMMPVEIAGITNYLMSKSSQNKVELLQPPTDYKPDATKGKELFSQKGCLACHSHKDFPGANETFGPRLDKVHEKIKPGKEGFRWLFSWIKDPERYHTRTKMPDLFVEPKAAADIAAFLQEGGVGEFKPIVVDEKSLNELTNLFLLSALPKEARLDFLGDVDKKIPASRKYPLAPKDIKGDEIELVSQHEGEVTDAEWKQMRLNYVGRKSVSRYGCFGCHDIPGFENARPIGTALQDWGRKDTSKLAVEHIAEFLHHHGEPDGSSTYKRVETAIKQMEAGGYKNKVKEEKEMTTAFFYESLHHHGRPGFLWQKLRAPRSYDFKKIETKRYDERLKMPKFPLTENDIEEIATFVLGLTASPPAEQYLYRPSKQVADRIEGERLLKKFNCVGCHMIDLPEFKYGLPTENPGLDDGLAGKIGMSKKDVIAWLNNNRKKLLASEAVEIPKGVDVVLYNASTFSGEKLAPLQQAAKLAQLIEPKYQDIRRYQQLEDFFTQHPEILLAKKLHNNDFPRFVKQILAMKRPKSGNTTEKFFNSGDFANWLVATVEDPKPQYDEQFKKLRSLGVDTFQLQKFAKSILDGEYDTDAIAFEDHVVDEEIANVKKEMSQQTSGREEFLILFNKHWKILATNLDKPDKELQEKEKLSMFADWLSEMTDIIEDEDDFEEFKKEQAERSKKKPAVLHFTKEDIKTLVRFLKKASAQELDFGELLELDFADSLEEIADHQKVVTQRNELLKLFKANKANFTSVLGTQVIKFHGINYTFPNTEEPLIDQSHGVDSWETVEVGGRLLLPGQRVTIDQTRLVDFTPSRSGKFASWLVNSLVKSKKADNSFDGWQQSPPPLYLEGAKVQTPWLYRFLKEPNQIRFTTVLRMPKFNMSDKEARALANYFAAADGAPYPYQLVEEREPPYIAEQNKQLKSVLGGKDYLTESWTLLNGQVCIGCHSVGGRKYVLGPPSPDGKKAARGPNLFNVQNRLRPEWAKLWISHPTWFAPYTSMLQNFSRSQPKDPHLFKGMGDLQVIGIGDALMNYKKMIEDKGKTPPFVEKPAAKKQ